LLKSFRRSRNKGFTLVELLVVVAILAILSVALLPSVLGYSDKARNTRAAKDIRNFNTVVEAFAATNGNYPEASLDTDNPRSIASVMQSKGIRWTGDETGVVDPWNNPYYYDLTEDYYCIGSAGKDGTLNTADDICNIGGKVSKKASGLNGNAIPSAVPGNNPGNGNEPGHITEVPEGYIGIYTPEQLASIGVDPDYPRDGQYILMAQLDLSDYENWAPIGNESKPFIGKFNGNNYVISNLIINSDKNYIGLFGHTKGNAEITDLGLENVDVTGYKHVGGLVGYNNSSIENCYATGKVTGNFTDTGGLVGINKGTVKNCYAISTIIGEMSLGGLVGTNNTSAAIENCYSTSEVTGNTCNIGNLAGYNNGSITNCYATGKATGNDKTGGLVGCNHSSGTIEDCYATSEVTGNNQNTGGLVGESLGSIKNSYATGEVFGTNNNTGGLVGYNNSSAAIEDCHATGKVTGSGYIGGLVGYNSSNATIKNSYATGEVTGNDRTGGLAGYNYSGTIEDCYAIGNVTGEDYVGGFVGQNSSSSANIIKLPLN
jgi:type II secretion system protein G